MNTTLKLEIRAFAFACLRGLVAREIQQVERHRRVLGIRTSKQELELTDAYLRQLRDALQSIEAVYDEMGAT